MDGMIFQKAGRRRLIRRWLIAELAVRSRELAADEAERVRAAKDARKPIWTLAETLAWVATRLYEALPHGDGDGAGLSVWIAIRTLRLAPLDASLPAACEAWGELAAKLSRGILVGTATHSKEHREGGRVFHRVGVPFPPPDQPGFPLECDVHGGRLAIVAPTGWRWHMEWDQFQKVCFAREDVLRVFPPLPIVVEAEFEAMPGELEVLRLSRPPIYEPASSPETPRPSSGHSQAAARAAFDRLVMEWRADGENRQKRPTREKAIAKLQSEVPGLSVSSGRQMWAELAPAEWRGKGPRGPRAGTE